MRLLLLTAATLALAAPLHAQKRPGTVPPRAAPPAPTSAPVLRPGAVLARTPASVIAEKARTAALGRPLMPAPAALLPPFQAAWWQQFETGAVYYEPSRGVFAMPDVIRAAWRAAGGEDGTLGFPTSDAEGCRPFGENLMQRFDRGVVVFFAATRATSVHPNPDPGTLEGADGICGLPNRAPAAARARFRVTLNGFTVRHQTWDHAGEVDGKGDEVYVTSMSRVFGAAGSPAGTPRTVRSRVMGDVNGQTGRVRAGSRSAQGGLQTDDRVPGTPPWRRTAEPATEVLPMLLWQGELRDGHELLALAPTLWEWDGDAALRGTIAGVLGFIPNAFRNSFGSAGEVRATDRPADLRRKLLHRHSALQLLSGAPGASFPFQPSAIGDAQDRPIGLTVGGFDPQVVVLTYQLADAVSRADFGFGRGVVDIEYVDTSELAGDYVLYVQIERIP